LVALHFRQSVSRTARAGRLNAAFWADGSDMRILIFMAFITWILNLKSKLDWFLRKKKQKHKSCLWSVHKSSKESKKSSKFSILTPTSFYSICAPLHMREKFWRMNKIFVWLNAECININMLFKTKLYSIREARENSVSQYWNARHEGWIVFLNFFFFLPHMQFNQMSFSI